MHRIPTTPIVGVEKRQYRKGQDGPFATKGKGISEKVDVKISRSGPPGTISVEQAKELLAETALTDEQVEEIKEQVRLLVEVIYEKWLQDGRKHSRGG